MSRSPGRPSWRKQAADTVCAASELLEVLWGRGQDATHTGTVSPSQLRALVIIERHEGINLSALGAGLGSRASSVTRLCDRMEAMGLLERCPSPASRRETELWLTVRGRTLLAEHRAIRTREVARVLEAMEPAAVEALVEGLAAFQTAARSTGTAAPAPGPAVHGGREHVADSA